MEPEELIPRVTEKGEFLVQTELAVGIPSIPLLVELGFKQDSQNGKVCQLLTDYYNVERDLAWVSMKHISTIVPGGVTRRINDIRVMLQPEKSLRGVAGW